MASSKRTNIGQIHYRVSPDVRFTRDKDGTAILSIEQGKFYSLIGVGSRIWSRIAGHPKGVTLDSLVDDLLDNDFNGEPEEKVQTAVQCLLKRLTQLGVVESSDSQSSAKSDVMRRRISTLLGALGRRISDLLIQLNRPRAAAFVEFAMFHLIRKVGRFAARRQILEQWNVITRPIASAEAIPKLCGIINEAASWYPKESLCLQKASVTTCLLRQHGLPAELKIGIRKQPFRAHAWVEVAGKVVSDHKGVQKYFNEIMGL